jgi:hypothetical protein
MLNENGKKACVNSGSLEQSESLTFIGGDVASLRQTGN